MQLFVISDIFGATPALAELVAGLADCYRQVLIIDPYGGVDMAFPNEAEAYGYFQQHGGPGQLLEQVKTQLRATASPFDLLGFSVGATCAWQVSACHEFKQLRHCSCFYGSRIRDHLDSQPQCPTSLVFPCREKSFAIDPFIDALQNKPNTTAIKTEYLHGFMNSLSQNYSAHGYRFYLNWLREKAAQLPIAGPAREAVGPHRVSC
ncbi:dienelactone hydrolase family protein [Pelobacter seleniigenes]|uniref:dienelactone hydrolase family protein n=1 Tax=Pelobacter seleniigenes TaxID=407188 RepID=UPI00068E3B8A|nr:dienelactone hydrolase family protein [Pelobacter seleniigenes]